MLLRWCWQQSGHSHSTWLPLLLMLHHSWLPSDAVQQPGNKTATTEAAEADVEAENAAAAKADQDLLSQIIQGYTTDPWFAKGSNTAWLDIHKGLYYRGVVCQMFMISSRAFCKSYMMLSTQAT